MMERVKTTALIILVVLSLIQSYFLAYSFPNLGARVKVEQEYVQTETMGQKQRVEHVIFPEDIVLHAGGNRHTLLYPNTVTFNEIMKRFEEVEFSGFLRHTADSYDWAKASTEGIGAELRFGSGVPVSLLQKFYDLDGDFLFLGDTIERIWVMKRPNQDTVETFFFSSDGKTVYESVREVLTLQDVQEFASYGSYLPSYQLWRGSVYLPETAVETIESSFGYTAYSPEQMQRNLFFDPEKTRNLEDWNGSQIYTDGKRGLQLGSGGTWMVYTDPVAPLDSPNDLGENMLAGLQFVNDHGGWDGRHRYVVPADPDDGRIILFQQYYDRYPVLGSEDFEYGHIRLVVQQGVVSEFERSLLTRGERSGRTTERWLPGSGSVIEELERYPRHREVVAVFPAQQVTPTDEGELHFAPVWAVRLSDGTEHKLMDAMPAGTVPEQPLKKLPKLQFNQTGQPADEGSGLKGGGSGGDSVLPLLPDPRSGAGAPAAEEANG
ncbi:YycH family regulatory protein [Paenibacillus tarimensis]|uniref:YycH family regulatory protein n=1 Tax=Paenibacillus tarimensis TaxID=416012 RepID=UPI001F46BB1C|nr:two-component system activity regulator YycH [Paenibacillus tarimensis]MCF2944506.1 two-component system activity regulator YycH [Paenibacillus tarimensis]